MTCSGSHTAPADGHVGRKQRLSFDCNDRIFLAMKPVPYDLRFVEMFYELYALEDYIDSIESQLPVLIEREKEKTYQNMPECDSIEWLQREQALYALIEDVIPRYFRNPIVVNLWAIFESAIIEIAKEIKDHQGLPITLDDIKGDFLERTNKYFNHIIKFPIDVRGSSWQHFRKFYLLRNALAHGNGRLDNIQNQDDFKHQLGLDNENGEVMIRDGNIFCSPSFIKNTLRIVFDFLGNITGKVKDEYP
jgi:hypothetical protein